MGDKPVSFLSSKLQVAKGVAQAPAPDSASGKAPDAAVAQSLVNHAVEISSLKGELERVRSELSVCKAKLVDLEKCIVMLDEQAQRVQNESLKGLADKLQSVADAQGVLAEQVNKVVSGHEQLAGSLDDRIKGGVQATLKPLLGYTQGG